MSLPADYFERVYSGVLGKIVGVYLGRPFEGWPYEKIMAELGEVNYYVHEKRGVPLIVTDDDISGTFTFLRAMSDFGYPKDLTARQIGQTWLNYLIEKRTVLWWGGLGNSTEHTAYIRLKHGVPAPLSGAIATNGKVVAEQIGAQIFIDGWAMIAPGDPALAADLARRAGSVSHDGEAIYGAQVIAAMEAQAFVEQDIEKLLDCGVSFIPKDSVIYRMIDDLRGWHAEYRDWHQTFNRIVANYGYDKYGGNCHVVPNHALIVLGLLYGGGDFQKSLMITNTAGWDTDCNSGNIGCLLGIRNGLEGFDLGPDWRGPVADRLYLPTADGGRVISDALIESYAIANTGRALRGQPPLSPKGGARFHFSLPGSVQGFQPEPLVGGRSPAHVFNAEGHSLEGLRSLGIAYAHTAPGQPARVATSTFVEPVALNMPGYGLMACPTLYPGQTVAAAVEADALNQVPAELTLYLRYFGAGDTLQRAYGPKASLRPGERAELSWQIPETGSCPIAEIGLEIDSPLGRSGVVYLDKLTWSGAPSTTFTRPSGAYSKAWQISWINAASDFPSWSEPFRIVQDEGTGLLIQGTSDWQDYRVETVFTPHMAAEFGLAARVQGLLRYYALVLGQGNKARLVKVLYDQTIELGETDFAWEFGQPVPMALEVKGSRITAWVDGKLLCSAVDAGTPFLSGGIALLVTEGRAAADSISVQPC
jgi:ADP-ribosylglycohydrolase